MSSPPLKTARIISLSLLFDFAVIGGSVGLNALIKGNQQKSKLRKVAPPGAVIDINTDDIFHTGVVITTLCALLGVLSPIFLLLTFRSSSRGLLRIQGAILAFISVWLFATLIPFDHFFATRGPAVSASLDGFQLPPSIVQPIEQSLGAPTEYRHINYLRLVAIIPWFTILFAVISSVLLFVTAARIGVSHKEASVDEHEHVVTEKA